MPKPRRKIIAYIATSADGFIARPDGDVAWLERSRPKGNYGIGAFFKTIDTIPRRIRPGGRGNFRGLKLV